MNGLRNNVAPAMSRRSVVLGMCDAPVAKTTGTVGKPFADFLRHIRAAHVGQVVVAHEQVDLAGVEQAQRTGAVGSLQHGVAHFAEHLRCRRAHEFVVLDEQDAQATLRIGRREIRRHRLPALRLVAQHVPHFARQRFAAVRLAQQFDAGIEPSAMHDRVVGVARGEQDRDIRQTFARLARQFRTAHGTRHHHVGEQQIDRRAALDDGERVFGVLRFQHRVAEIAQQFDDGFAHFGIVFDDEHEFRSADDGAGVDVDGHVLGLQHARQIDAHRRAVAGFAVDVDVAVGLLDEAVHHAQAEPGALAFGFGGEERFEDVLHHLAASCRSRCR